MKFIHFGCWNEGYCDKKNTNINGLSATMDLLNKTVDEAKLKDTPFDFISVAGDNYYATKVPLPVEHLVFDETNFESGFNCLPKDIMKIIILGNHEIEKNVEFDGSIVNCGSLKKQVLLAKKDPSIKFFNDTINLYNSNTLIIFIDTTIYTMKDQQISETCYKTLDIDGKTTYKVFNNTDETHSINELVEYMNNKILEIINNTILSKGADFKNLIIVGHEPIYALKNKKDKNKVSSIIKLIDLFNTRMIPILVENNIKTYFLCADTHIYQKGIITFDNMNYKVEQHVVGTGGAHQDTISTVLRSAKPSLVSLVPSTKVVHQDKTSENMLEYDIMEQSDKFGFITVEIHDNNVNIKYIPVTIDIMKGGMADNNYYNKYLKYKIKYFLLRKNTLTNS